MKIKKINEMFGTPMKGNKIWTVGELIEELNKYPKNYDVQIEGEHGYNLNIRYIEKHKSFLDTIKIYTN
jgi:hypothetical protein